MRRLFLAALVLSGCAGTRGTPSRDAGTAGVSTVTSTSPALAAYATQRMLVLPVQALQGGDPMGWAAAIEDRRAWLAQFDSLMALELRNRGLSPRWASAGDLDRTARRNPVHVTAPGDIRAGDAVRTLERRRDDDIPEPIASQLRVLAGFHDARYAFVPSDVRFERGEFADAGRAIVRVGILDIRGSKLAFLGDVVGPDAGDATTALTNVGRRLADLIVSR